MYYTIKYYLRSDDGGKVYTPTVSEMDLILNREILGNQDRRCTIEYVLRNVVVFEAPPDAADYYISMFTNVDDDGNYYVKRRLGGGREISLGWFAKCVKKSRRPPNTNLDREYQITRDLVRFPRQYD